MRLSHKNRDRHARRVAARLAHRGIVAPVACDVPAPFNHGDTPRLITDFYGSRYKGRTVTVLSVSPDGVLVQSPYRKTPFTVALEHLKAA